MILTILNKIECTSIVYETGDIPQYNATGFRPVESLSQCDQIFEQALNQTNIAIWISTIITLIIILLFMNS